MTHRGHGRAETAGGRPRTARDAFGDLRGVGAQSLCRGQRGLRAGRIRTGAGGFDHRVPRIGSRGSVVSSGLRASSGSRKQAVARPARHDAERASEGLAGRATEFASDAAQIAALFHFRAGFLPVRGLRQSFTIAASLAFRLEAGERLNRRRSRSKRELSRAAASDGPATFRGPRRLPGLLPVARCLSRIINK